MKSIGEGVMKKENQVIKINNSGKTIVNIKSTSDIMQTLLSILYSFPVSSQKSVTETLDTLVNSGKMSRFEAFRFKRLHQVSQKADIIINGDNNQVGKIVVGDYHEIHVDFDWYMRFFDCSTGTSNDILQDIWAQLLANEIEHPNSCSLRTLDIVRNMSVDEAKSFEKICKYIIRCGNFDHFIFDVGFVSNLKGNGICKKYITDAELNFEADIVPLQECNLIQRDRTIAFDYKTQDENTLCMNFEDLVFTLNFSKEIEKRIQMEDDDRVLFYEDVYYLTKSGIELYRSLKNAGKIITEIEYLIACFFYYEKKYQNIRVELMLKNGNGYTNDILSLSREQAKQLFSDELASNDKFMIPLICQTINKYREVIKGE